MRMRRHSAFTLIELLVVIGVIALLTGAMAFALRDGDRATAIARRRCAVGKPLWPACSPRPADGRPWRGGPRP
ncbi:MAG: type II secretion system protein [Opitutales bacterium]